MSNVFPDDLVAADVRRAQLQLMRLIKRTRHD